MQEIRCTNGKAIRNRGFEENRMTNFPWGNQGILHGRENVRQILKKVENLTNLANRDD